MIPALAEESNDGCRMNVVVLMHLIDGHGIWLFVSMSLDVSADLGIDDGVVTGKVVRPISLDTCNDIRTWTFNFVFCTDNE